MYFGKKRDQLVTLIDPPDKVTNRHFQIKKESWAEIEKKLTFNPTTPTFNDPGKKAFLKKMCEKGKLVDLVMPIFTYSHNIFYPIKEKMHHLSQSKRVFCKCFQSGHD